MEGRIDLYKLVDRSVSHSIVDMDVWKCDGHPRIAGACYGSSVYDLLSKKWREKRGWKDE